MEFFENSVELRFELIQTAFQAFEVAAGYTRWHATSGHGGSRGTFDSNGSACGRCVRSAGNSRQLRCFRRFGAGSIRSWTIATSASPPHGFGQLGMSAPQLFMRLLKLGARFLV
jgi:hypothetical protein